MSGIRRVSQLGTAGESTLVDGSVQAVDIADGSITSSKIASSPTIATQLSVAGMQPKTRMADTRTSVGQYDSLGQIDFSTNADNANPNNNPSASINGILMSPGPGTDMALNFSTGNKSSNSTAMFIYPDGQVTAPRQASFMARLGVAQSYSFTGSQEFAFNDVRWNIGSNYNSTTGRFTAPISGKYFLSAGLMQAASATGFLVIEFMKNGVIDYSLASTSTSVSSGEGATQLGTIVLLSAGDYVTMRTYKSYAGLIGNGTGTADWGVSRNFFSMHLLG